MTFRYNWSLFVWGREYCCGLVGSVFQIMFSKSAFRVFSMAGVGAKVPSSLLHCTRSAAAC